jgi:hypothetical protein
VADAGREPDPLTVHSLLTVFGGVKGLLDSTVPSLVFVLVRLFADLNTAIAAAVAAGLVVVALRAARGEPLQQAFSGFFGLLVAVLIARSTGTGKGFFLPGILITAGSGVGFGISLLVGRPVVALGLTAVDPRYGVWREHAALRRACVLSTAVWTASFFVRAAVATTVLLLVGDDGTDNLVVLVVINAVKWPLIIGSALLTVALVRAADVPALEDEPTAP